MKTIVISDIHLGSEVCQAKDLTVFLEGLEGSCERLLVAGDFLDSMDFRRLKKTHWKVLSSLRRLSKKIDVVWICGNHDGPAEIVSHLIGVEVVDEFIFKSGMKDVLVFHGQKLDNFIDEYPILTWVADIIYGFLQWVDSSHYLARIAKHSSKHYLRCSEIMRVKAIQEASRRGCEIVVCGHSHDAKSSLERGVHYLNSGCWTERPCHYVSIEDGEATLHSVEELSELYVEN